MKSDPRLDGSSIIRPWTPRISTPRGPAAPPGVLDAPALKGSSPLFIAFGLMSAALVVYALSLFASERQSRSGWQLTQVVVASESANIFL